MIGDLEKLQRENARWLILCALNSIRPEATTEGLLLRVLHDSQLPLTPRDVRREVDYLDDRKLVTVRGKDGPTWIVEITHYGVDIVEYTIDCFPGIARPKKWL